MLRCRCSSITIKRSTHTHHRNLSKFLLFFLGKKTNAAPPKRESAREKENERESEREKARENGVIHKM